MEMYFIEHTPSEDEKTKMTKKGISTTDFSLELPPLERSPEDPATEGEDATPRTISGFLVEGPDNNKEVLKILKAKEISVDQTNYDGIFRLQIEIIKKYSVKRDPSMEWCGGNCKGFIDVVKKVLSPLIKKDIIIHPWHNRQSNSISDGKFHVHLWGGITKNNTGSNSPPNLFGIRVHCRDWSGWHPSENGVPLDEPDVGWTFGEYIPDNLYIFFDCFHFGNLDELTLFKEMLVFSSKFISGDKNTLKLIEEERRKAQIRHFINICKNRREEKVRTLKNKVLDFTHNINSLRKQMLQKIQDLDEFKSELWVMLNKPEEPKEKLIAELLRLETLPKVKKVQIYPTKVCIYTEPILCKDSRSNKIHEIGRFRLDLEPSARSSHGVKFCNLTRKVKGLQDRMNAPHVYEDGHACFGNAEEGVMEYLRKKEFVELTQYLIAFLESANINDGAGCHVNNWPVAAVRTIKRFEKKFKKPIEQLLG